MLNKSLQPIAGLYPVRYSLHPIPSSLNPKSSNLDPPPPITLQFYTLRTIRAPLKGPWGVLVGPLFSWIFFLPDLISTLKPFRYSLKLRLPS